MKVKLYKPQNPLLKKYIECFYTLQSAPENESLTYLAFPSIFSMVCLNANSKIAVSGNNLSFTNCPQNKLETNLICDFEESGLMKYEGVIDEIVIYFKPLGINAFLDKDLRYYLKSFFVKFSPFEDYQTAMLEIFSIADENSRIQNLENYWLSKYKGFEHPFLHQVVDELMIDGGDCSISDIASRNKISRPTLNKHFDLHICTTPSQFRKVVRFRAAMKRYRQKVFEENLADISYNAAYFDQSHMIKDFKALTKYSPKAFFSKLSSLEDGNINWLFL